MAAAHYFSVLAALLACGACAGSAPVGTSCTQSSQCETGLACLYPLGAGCGASGQCTVPSTDCSGPSAEGLVLCACAGAVVDFTCIPSSAALPQRTASGAACRVDAGPAGDAAIEEAGEAGH